jgi:hypothetical protein
MPVRGDHRRLHRHHHTSLQHGIIEFILFAPQLQIEPAAANSFKAEQPA